MHRSLANLSLSLGYWSDRRLYHIAMLFVSKDTSGDQHTHPITYNLVDTVKNHDTTRSYHFGCYNVDDKILLRTWVLSLYGLLLECSVCCDLDRTVWTLWTKCCAASFIHFHVWT
jgi:hypothetical protein